MLQLLSRKIFRQFFHLPFTGLPVQLFCFSVLALKFVVRGKSQICFSEFVCATWPNKSLKGAFKILSVAESKGN